MYIDRIYSQLTKLIIDVQLRIADQKPQRGASCIQVQEECEYWR